ncbi:MAG: hypothetical protein HC933_16860 [Pleurocapsa sp. SU_196_0]|nr:hypothetical protein [Pleurocapsa sp. SU_196_0]
MTGLILGIMVLFVVMFVGIWGLVVFILSQLGWRGLMRWQTRNEPTGKAFGWSAATVGVVKFRHSLNVWVDREGFWLKPVRVFALFHPTLFIPWRDVRTVEHQRVLLAFTAVSVELQGSDTKLLFWDASGSALLEAWEGLQPRAFESSSRP